MIGRSRLTLPFTRRFAAQGVGALGQAFRKVPGSYTVASGVAPLEPSACPSGGLYEDDTLCCIQEGGNQWKCRRVNVPEKGAPSTATKATSDTCLRGIQIYLSGQNQIPYASATGQWNPETETALAYRFPNPRAYPGGSCAMLTIMGLQPAPMTAGMFPGLPGITPTAIAVVGIAIAAALFLARRPA